MKPLNQSRACPRCKAVTAYYDPIARAWRCPCGWRDRQATRSVMVNIALALVLLAPSAARAQDLGVWLSREDAARVFGQAAKIPALEGQIKALEAENAELRAGRDAALKLVEITEKVLAAQERLGQLADEERDAHKDRAERLQKEKGQGRMWITIQARGAMAGLLCSPAALTGVGLPIVAGCAVVGGIAGAVEAWVSER